ncbi:eukaryotic translation initiation factor 4E1 [Drosophila simulans]|uniref:eIF-4F 25 kDa subunit n=1 Tax=Drosophila simulans TaxID=7240 RepID=B4QZE9_DROSI|nr:eukaryotic translation initiation factor 4E1 [Drosophila simulans]XP_016036758.1 eukaryotic translation initiation factor 4E1 [Drosophila simulans]XP_039151381.1 eukaryotic translation initiation factor 4E1 [Drosophila simulans]EDX14787.1 GD18002 [Drosophila simulans]KMZ06516.1 uncharacterized protein Dsimw501_GD18002, isoform A [Drosophila simulans]KMZ06517.1 uncharacterized protein Dsimw501_GD18002, isoform B [Drosophila simulans]
MENSRQSKESSELERGTSVDDYKLASLGATNKHQLQNTWTLWGVNYDPEIPWEDMLKEIDSFDTVEDFWNLYFSIDTPSKLNRGCDYMLFKKGIRPMWEDPPNKGGGRWTNGVDKRFSAELDKIWLDVLLCIIGEACDHCDQICGALVRIRKNINKVSVWTKADAGDEAIREIGHKLSCEVLNLKGKKNWIFFPHGSQEG